jgi:hypothetical protein
LKFNELRSIFEENNEGITSRGVVRRVASKSFEPQQEPDPDNTGYAFEDNNYRSLLSK